MLIKGTPGDNDTNVPHMFSSLNLIKNGNDLAGARTAPWLYATKNLTNVKVTYLVVGTVTASENNYCKASAILSLIMFIWNVVEIILETVHASLIKHVVHGKRQYRDLDFNNRLKNKYETKTEIILYTTECLNIMDLHEWETHITR